MGRSSTTLKEGDNLPARGRSNKTKILDAIRQESLEDLTEDHTRDEAEVAWFRHIVKRAKNPDDKDSAMLLKWLGDKGWSNVKPTMERIEFELSEGGTPLEQANQVLKAASLGVIPPDTAQVLISSIGSLVKIDEVTEVRKELEEIKKVLNESIAS